MANKEMTKKASILSKAFILNIIVNSFAFLSFNMSTSAFPIIVSSIGASHFSTGLSTSLSAISALLIRPVSGALADKYNCKRVAELGLLLMLLAPALCATTSNLAVILVARTVQGLGWGCASTTCSKLIADSLPRERLSEGVGYAGFLSSTCSAFAPSVSALILSEFSSLWVLLIISAFATIPFVVLFFNKNDVAKRSIASEKINTNEKHSFVNRGTVISAVIICFITLSYSSIITFISQYAIEACELKPIYFFAAYSVATIIIRPLTGLYFDKFNALLPSIFSAITMFFGLLCLCYCKAALTLALSGVMLGLSMGSAMNSLQSMAIVSVSKKQRGLAISFFLFGFDLGMTLGGIISGAIVSYLGFLNMLKSILLVPLITLIIIISFNKLLIFKKISVKH